MNALNDILFTPEEYKEAAFMAEKAGHEMLSRLEWMTSVPKVILELSRSGKEMNALLQARYPGAQVISLIDGNSLPLEAQSVDLIFANFFLPWQTDIKTILKECARVLVPDGIFMLSALGVDTLTEWQALLKTEEMPRCADMHEIGDALMQSGFIDPVLDVDHYHVQYRDQARLIKDLLLSDMWFPKEKEINVFADENISLKLTYEVIYAHAFAKAKSSEFSQDDEGIVRIPLAHLRRR